MDYYLIENLCYYGTVLSIVIVYIVHWENNPMNTQWPEPGSATECDPSY
jgi:hypothetical protein